MARLGLWVFGLAVAALAIRGLVAFSEDGLSDGWIGALTFALCLGGVWTVYMREERDS